MTSVQVHYFGKGSEMHRPGKGYIRTYGKWFCGRIAYTISTLFTRFKYLPLICGTMLKSQSGEQLPVKLRSEEPHDPPIIERETHIAVIKQICLPFFVAGMGMVGAGIFLDMVQKWRVFIQVSEIIILVPSLLGLKGNLEMTLASRLSTQANLGQMDDPKEQLSMIIGNLSLVQCQAIVIGFLSSLVAVLMVGIMKNEFNMTHTLLLCSCSIVTASVASMVLGLVTAGVIVVSRWFGINPDNVATPIAGSLGDITSLALLSMVATIVNRTEERTAAVSIVIVFLFLCIMPFWFYLARQNKYTRTVLYTGWTPIIVAMLISTVGGLILDTMVKKYEGIAVFQPVINGVGGNLVSIQASRLATALHQQSELGYLPPNYKIWASPYEVFLSDKPHAVTARVLLGFVIPGHIIFAYTICYVQTGQISLSFTFLFFYLIAAFIQVALLLFLAYVLTNYFWSKGIDPDNTTIPYLTALGDLFGIILLGATFHILHLLGESDKLSG